MKADRARCLRCEQPLPLPPIGVASQGQPRNVAQLAAMAGAALAALVVVGWIALDGTTLQRQRPVERTRPSSEAGSVPNRADEVDSQEPPPFTPVTFMDETRSAGGAFQTGDFESARSQYEAALQKRPDDPETLNNLGLTLERLGDVSGAIARFERAIALSADKWSYHFNLAHALARSSNWDRAIAEYRQAAQLFPDDYATQFNLALTLQKKGDDQTAIPEFEKAITLAPGEPSFHLALGNSLTRLGRIADARAAFERYLELDPEAGNRDQVKAHIETLSAASAATLSNASPTPLSLAALPVDKN
jgi:tetratricopeptide (TPR) repeat protein